MTRWTDADLTRVLGYRTAKPASVARRGSHKNTYCASACAYARSLGVPEPVCEYYPIPDREFRLDLAWPNVAVALEIQGGIWQQGAHSRGLGQTRDMEKHNLCTLAGWRILYTVPAQLGQGIQQAATLLGRKTMTHCYKLDAQHQPIPCNDILDWAHWFEKADRHVATTKSNDITVSTVFIGIDHSVSVGNSDLPLLFETMIFGGPHDQYQERYATWEEAQRGHEKAVALAGL